MRIFSTAREAKDFFAGKIIEQAKRENTPLSEAEQKMLLFTESECDARPEMLEWAERLEAECDAANYESKIAGLLKRAYERDVAPTKQVSAEDAKQEYRDAYKVVSTEDHYIRIMIDAALGRKLKRFFGLI